MRKKIYLLTLLFVHFMYAQVTFTTTPKDKQLYPRDLTTNQGNIVFSGSISGTTYTKLVLKISKNGISSSQEELPLTYTGSTTNFNFSVLLNTELSLYDLDLYGVTASGSETLLKSVEDILVGDVYLINGQSNAYAAPVSGYTTSLRSPYIVTYAGRANPYNDNWYQANGDSEYGFIGQWGLKMARQIVDNYQVPVAILNEADPGTPISNFRRDDSNHYNTGTNYGRLLTRAKNAGIQNHIRGIFYYQGEWDGSNAIGHKTGFTKLYNNWHEDYPDVERFYAMQVREGCGSPSLELRNYQRLFQDELENFTTITSNGLTGHDGCHFYYSNGYETLGQNVYRIVAMQLYGAPVNPNYYSINVESVVMNTPNQITITTRNNNENLIWNSGAEDDFSVDNSNIDIVSGTVSGNKIILTLSTSIEDYSEINTISYKGHSGRDADWIYNTEGSSLFSFYQIPVSHTFTTPQRDLGAGYALTFDGSNDYVETNLSLSSSSYTKEAWIKLDNRGRSNNIISGMSRHAFWAPNGRLAAGNNGAWNTVQDPETLSEGIWYHVAVTYNSATKKMKLYKNGILVSEASNIAPATSDAYTLIGSYGRGSVFDGTIDEVKIWNTERTQEEIRTLMCAKNTNVTDPSLLAYYRFDQSKSSTSIDLTGKYNGTLQNFDTRTAWVVSGAAVGDSSAYNYSEDYSVTITGADGNTMRVNNVTGTPKGVHIYTINERAYSTYPNADEKVADNSYGVFIANSATYQAEMTYNTNYNNILYKEGGDDLTWKLNLEQHNNTETNTLELVNQNIYLQEYTLVALDKTYVTPRKDLGAGYALTFDGSNDYVETNLSLSSSSYTKEAWIKLDNRGRSNNIISGMSYHAFWAPSGRLSAGNNGAWYTVRDPETLSEGVWYHVAVTYDSQTREMKLYKNGIVVSQASNVAPANSDNYTLIGSYGRGNMFSGIMDEVKIWNTARTQEEIRTLMCAKANTATSSLLAYYTFNQSKGAVLIDLTGNYNGTLQNFDTEKAWSISGAPIGDHSAYNYSGDYAVSITGADGNTMRIDTLSGTPEGVHVYAIDEKTYATYPNGEAYVADNLYGVFIANSATYTAEMTYSGSNSNSILYKEGGDDLTWKLDANQIDHTTTNTLELSGETKYVREYTLVSQTVSARKASSTPVLNEESKTTNVKVYPTPSTGVIYVKHIGNENTPILVYNVYGQLVYQSKTSKNGVDQLNLSALPKGLYFMKIGNESRKIVLK